MDLKTNSLSAKIGLDLYYIQMKWSFWFIPILFAIYLITNHFFIEIELLELSFVSFMYQPAKIYMLVIGIISCLAFLPYYVKNGLTRKDYFTGSVLAATGVAFTIMLISLVLATILQWNGTFTAYSPGTEHVHFFHESTHWIIPVVGISLIILSYYIGGWLIAIGFYRYGVWGGLGFIIIALLYMSLIDLLWEGKPTLPFANFIPISQSVSLTISIIGTTLLVITGFVLLYHVNKRVPIKVD